MNMLDVCKCMGGNASYALLRQRTRWDLNSSILLMALFTLMVLMAPSGFSVRNASRHTISTVFTQISQIQQNGPFYAPFWSVKSKRVEVDLPESGVKQVIFKRVTVSVPVVKQKVRKPKVRHGKDGRRIGPRREASSGKNKKEQQWTQEDIDKAFDLWEANKDKPPEEQLSKRQISIDTGVPYTTVCERLSGRRGGGRRGKIAGGKRQPRVLNKGKQAGNCNRLLTTDYPLDLTPRLFPFPFHFRTRKKAGQACYAVRIMGICLQ